MRNVTPFLRALGVSVFSDLAEHVLDANGFSLRTLIVPLSSLRMSSRL